MDFHQSLVRPRKNEVVICWGRYPPEVSEFAPEESPKPNRTGSASCPTIFQGLLLLNFGGV